MATDGSKQGHRTDEDAGEGDDELPLGAEAGNFTLVRQLATSLKSRRVVTVTTELLKLLADERTGPLCALSPSPSTSVDTHEFFAADSQIAAESSAPCSSPTSAIPSSPFSTLETPEASPERPAPRPEAEGVPDTLKQL